MTRLYESTSFDWLSRDYASVRGGPARAEQIRDAIDSILPRGTTLLDVGGGPGSIARELIDRGHKVIALDISRKMCDLSRSLGVDTVCADAEKLPFASETFDHVIFVWSINHIGNPWRALEEAKRMLKPNGSILILSGIPMHPTWDLLGKILSRLDVLRARALAFESELREMRRQDGWETTLGEDVVVTFRQRANGLADRIESRQYGHLRVSRGEDSLISDVVDQLRSLPLADDYSPRQNNHALYIIRKRSF